MFWFVLSHIIIIALSMVLNSNKASKLTTTKKITQMTSKVSRGDPHDLSATEKPLRGGGPSAARNLPRKMTAEVMDAAGIQTLSSAQTRPSSGHLETQEC